MNLKRPVFREPLWIPFSFIDTPVLGSYLFQLLFYELNPELKCYLGIVEAIAKVIEISKPDLNSVICALRETTFLLWWSKILAAQI